MPKSVRMHWRLLVAIVLAAFVFKSAADAQRATVKVMTYNIFQGTDFTEVISAQSYPEFLAAAQLTLQQVKDSNPPARMEAIAREIAISQPDLVGLEEATLWRYGVGPNPTDVMFDPLDELLSRSASSLPISKTRFRKSLRRTFCCRLKAKNSAMFPRTPISR